MHKFNFLKKDKRKWGKQKILKPENKEQRILNRSQRQRHKNTILVRSEHRCLGEYKMKIMENI